MFLILGRLTFLRVVVVLLEAVERIDRFSSFGALSWLVISPLAVANHSSRAGARDDPSSSLDRLGLVNRSDLVGGTLGGIFAHHHTPFAAILRYLPSAGEMGGISQAARDDH